MYQFSGKLKMFAIALMVLGALGTIKSFMDAPKNLEVAKEIMAQSADAHKGGHGNTHNVAKEAKTIKEEKAKVKTDSIIEEVVSVVKTDKEEVITNSSIDEVEETLVSVEKKQAKVHAKDKHEAHAEHVYHQMKNRPWSAFYVAMLFFLGTTLTVMAFYAAQRLAQAGWSVVLFRVMEAITSNIHYISIFMLAFIILTAMHKAHLFPWMAEGVFDPKHENYDAIVDGKKWWMNLPGWTIRSIFYLVVWNVFRFIIRKKSIKQDNGDLKLHKNIYNWNVGFVVFFLITESMASWDWIMGIDPHWFSTLFGWYVLSTFLVSALTVIAMVTVYLRSKGALPLVNDSHIHDLAKFMFGFSVFWTYLWFSQFMLIWYADMPEETTYYLQRFNEYNVPFWGMLVLNFILPVLLLINSDYKSKAWFVIMAGVLILVGHYVDIFVMVMPGTVGGQWGFGFGEIGGILFFTGLFIYATFTAFSKVNPVAKGNPFLHESETHHYYNIEHSGEENEHH